MKKSGAYWTEAEINSSKQKINKELEQIQNQGGAAARQLRILDRIKELESHQNPKELLELFVYLVAALVHHSHHPFLNPSRSEKILEHARTILQSQGMREGRSKVAFLHGELHFIQSQIERQQGNHWTAAWHQFMGYNATRSAAPDGEGLQQLSLGLRSMRLGHTKLASSYFERGETILSGEPLERCRMSHLICLRLLGEKEEALDRLQLLRTRSDTSEEARREIAWEEGLHKFIDNNDLQPLLMLTKKNQLCYSSGFLIELSLLAMSTPSRQWLERVPKLENLRRRKDLDPPRHDLFLNLAKNLQEAYEPERPMTLRLQRVGSSLSMAQGLLNVEKELLYWAAAARWLLRSKNSHLAKLALAEYQARCLLTSDGRTRDSFCVFSNTSD